MKQQFRMIAAPLALSAVAAMTLGATGPAASQPAPEAGARAQAQPAAAEVATRSGQVKQRRLLRKYTADTWRSFDAMTPRRSGLPADNIGSRLRPKSRSTYTSPTNIGAYLWSTVTARDTGLISAREAQRRMSTTLDTVAGMQRHRASGMYFNWYHPRTGKRLDVFPGDEQPLKQFVSSVDNGWLAMSLLLTERAAPQLARKANRIRSRMDFGFYYNAEENAPGGQIRGGFWTQDPQDGAAVKGNYRGRGKDVWYTGHHYGAFNTEPRIASYLGIAAGQIPEAHYYGTYRTFPNDTCDWGWTETKPVGQWRTYDGVRVFEGALPYRGMNIVPTWGGSMFEALMVPLFVPEETWGKRSWGVNHPLFVRGQIAHGMQEADYGYWGFSPSNNPAGGYREYGVDQLGLDTDGYTSDQERTSVDQPFDGCREGAPAPTSYGDGVVTPHASFLALRYAPRAAMRNLANIKADFDAYGKGGFHDAVAVRSGQVSKRYLALDQGMIMAALGNELARDNMRRYVARGAMQQTLRPMMRQEVFSAEGRRR